MKLNNSEIDLGEAILLDYYVTGFWWAKEQGFTTQQISGFFSILHLLLENIKGMLLSCTLSKVAIGKRKKTNLKGFKHDGLKYAFKKDAIHTSCWLCILVG